MMKKRTITFLTLIAIVAIFYIAFNRQSEVIIPKELLNEDEIDYIEITSPASYNKIIDADNIEAIAHILQQSNGPAQIEPFPAEEPIVSFSIALKDHYPSGTIFIYEDKIFFNQGRHVSAQQINDLVTTIENAF